MRKSSYLDLLITTIISLIAGGIIMILLGHNPFIVYAELFKGAFIGKFNIGNTLGRFVPILLTAIAFAISFKVSVFNAGVEGELYLGAIAAAWAGFAIPGLPKVLHILVCMIIATIVGALWAAVPGVLKAYYRVNEICTTLLLNYVAIFFASYLVNNQLSSHTGIPQTPEVLPSATLTMILKPSKANTGIFIALAVLLFVYWLIHYTTLGYKIRSVGSNPFFSDYIGIGTKKMMVIGMLISGGIGGLAGGIESLGIYNRFLDGFSQFIAFDGMLASLIARNNIKMITIIALFLASLKNGALGMERFTGVPKSIVDAIIAIFILLTSLEELINIRRKTKTIEA